MKNPEVDLQLATLFQHFRWTLGLEYQREHIVASLFDYGTGILPLLERIDALATRIPPVPALFRLWPK